MTLESLGLPTRCPECEQVIRVTETECPHCGYSLKKSVLEEEAFLYQQDQKRPKKGSLWTQVAFIVLSLFLVFACYSITRGFRPTAVYIRFDTGELIIAWIVTALFIGLTIFSFYNSRLAAIAGLLLYTFILSIVLNDLGIGFLAENLDSFYPIIILFFPLALLKTIYDQS